MIREGLDICLVRTVWRVAHVVTATASCLELVGIGYDKFCGR